MKAFILALLIMFIPACVLAGTPVNVIPESFSLLNNASASSSSIQVDGGNYQFNLSGTFGGATVAINDTINGVTTALGSYTSAPSSAPCFVIPAGSTVQATVTGGSPSGLYAQLGGVGSCSPGNSGGSAFTTDINTPATTSNNAAFQGAVAMTVGTTYAAQRSVAANCTVAGNMAVTFPDASTLTVPVQVGFQTFPFAVTAVTTSGTTATCTYSNLK